MSSLITRVSDAVRVLRGKPVALYGDRTGDPARAMLMGVLPGGGAPPERTTADFLEAYSTMPWLRAVTNKVATSAAATGWRLFVPERNGRARRERAAQSASWEHRAQLLTELKQAGQLRELTDHPLLSLLHNANPVLTGAAVRKLTQIHLDLVGEAFWLKERNGVGMPVAIWPLPPHWVRRTPTPNRQLFELGQSGWRAEVPETEVLWFADPDPSNPYGRGSGTANSLADELETDEYAAKHTKSWFYNRARPDVVIAAENMKREETERLEQDWLNKLQGFWRAYKPYFINRKIDLHTLSQTFENMQLTQLRQHERDTIIQVFGLPPELLGVLQNSNRATVEAAEFHFTKWVLTPRLEFLRDVLQERLVPEFDERLILDYVSPILEDKEFRLSAAKAAPYALSLDEWRALAGAAPLPGNAGRVHMLPFNLTPQELAVRGNGKARANGNSHQLAKRAESVPALNDGADTAVTRALAAVAPKLRARAWPTFRRACERVEDDVALHSIVSKINFIDADPDDPFYTQIHRIADRLTPRLRVAFLTAIAAARDEVPVALLEQILQTGQTQAAIDAMPWDQLTERMNGLGPIIALAIEQAGVASAQQLASEFGLDLRFDLTNPRAIAAARNLTAALADSVGPKSYAAIQDLIERAFVEGIPPRETARLMRENLGLNVRQEKAVRNFRKRLLDQGIAADKVEARVSRYADAQLRLRALTIARTETLRAGSQGQLVAWHEAADAGLIDRQESKRRWITTPDDRLDAEICEPMDGQEVGLDQPFVTGLGEEVDTSPAHPDCRCSASLVPA